MDLQIILIFILAVLVVTIVIVATYLILVLKDLRITIQKVNVVIENLEGITNAVTNPMSIVAGVLKGLKLFRNFQKED